MDSLSTVRHWVVVYLLAFLFSWLYILKFLIEVWKHRNSKESSTIKEAPSCLNNPDFGTHQTVTLKGQYNLNIHYVANGLREKPLMLFLHGFPDFWYGWRYQLKEFSKDYYAVAIDLPGYGESSKPDEVSKYSKEELARDVKEFITELGYSSCVLVGHDWGGIISYKFAADYPEMVDKLIIINSPHPAAFRKGMKTLKQLLMSSYIFFFQLPCIPDYMLSAGGAASLDGLRDEKVFKNIENFTEEDLKAYKFTFQRGGFTGPLNYYRMLFEIPKVKPVRMQMTMPSIIIWGVDDRALGTSLATLSSNYFDQVELKYIDRASHWPHVDQPETVNKHISEFLQQTE
ncbi:epoxide hydrolase 4-like [Hydractinia symbiolongicarpus]|uniref:epoxide hydrolase 4-like n=1 Tax=Hydractinia symbiolongicarpus TaxID=13093 RepID=UPI00254E818F|nr:epoxide hydrolase 4-like [Hydractinia symbiolongicarpus]